MKLGINASRARSGGARTHLLGILTQVEPRNFGFSEVHVWAHSSLIESLPVYPWLIKHQVSVADKALLTQLLWERYQLPGLIEQRQCDVLLNVDAGSVCRFSPAVTMSRDMLSYEPGEIERYGMSFARLRLVGLKYVQNASLRAAKGVIFLTKYAGTVIQRSAGKLNNVAYIPHGVSDVFRSIRNTAFQTAQTDQPIRCLYISNVAPYKHQWHVADAVRMLRNKGHKLTLTLTGGGSAAGAEKALERLNEALDIHDPLREYVVVLGYVKQGDLPALMQQADIFVFASSCENMPNTLVEAMAAGLPIACSNRGPMPEVLEDGGLYFDPEDPKSISSAIESLISSPDAATKHAARAKEIAGRYGWDTCAEQTFRFLSQVADRAKLERSFL